VRVTVTNGRVRFIEDTVFISNGQILYEDVTIAARVVRIFVGGEIQLLEGVAQTNSFRLFGGFSLTVSPTGLRVQGTMVLDMLRLANLSGSVDFEMSSAGIVASITVGTSGNTTIGRTGTDLTARFRLEINTSASNGTIQRIRVDSSTGSVVFSGGVPVLDSITVTARTVRVFAAGALIFRDGSGASQTESFRMNGAITLIVADGNLSVSANGYVDLGRIDSGLTLSMNSLFTINSSGVVASFALQAGSRVTRAGHGVSLDARFYLEVNTTSSSATVTRANISRTTGSIISGSTSSTIEARTIQIGVAGSVQLGSSSLFEVHGYSVLRFSSSGLGITFDAGFNFLGSNLAVSGSATIFSFASRGIVLNIGMSLNGNSTPLLNIGNFRVNSTVELQVNTRPVSSGGFAAGTVRVRVGGGLRIDGFNFSGAVVFTASGGLFSASISNTFSLFGFRNVSMSGTIRSDGYVSLSGSVSFLVGNRTTLGADVDLTVRFRLVDGVADFTASASGAAYLAGFEVVSASGSLNESGRLSLTFRVAGVSVGTYAWDLSASGAVLAGPVAGALVFFDRNGNLQLDENEPFAFADEEGRYQLPVTVEEHDRNGNGVIDSGDGFLVAIGGNDSFTGQPNLLVFRTSPEMWGTGVPVMLTPLTTLASALIDRGLSPDDADAALRRALGLDAFTYSIFNTNPLEAAGSTAALELYRAAVQVQSATAAAAGLLAGANGGDTAAGGLAFLAALADALLAAPSATIDSVLGSPTVLRTVLAAAAERTGATLPGALLEGAARIIAEVVGAIEATTLNDPAFLTVITRVKALATGGLADDLAAAATGTLSVDALVARNTGATLSGRITSVTGVTVVVPPVVPPEVDFEQSDRPDGSVQIIRRITLSEFISAELAVLHPDVVFLATVYPVASDRPQVVLTVRVEVSVFGDTRPVELALRSSLDGFASDLRRFTLVEGRTVVEWTFTSLVSTGPMVLALFADGGQSREDDYTIERMEITSSTAPTAPEIRTLVPLHIAWELEPPAFIRAPFSDVQLPPRRDIGAPIRPARPLINLGLMDDDEIAAIAVAGAVADGVPESHADEEKESVPGDDVDAPVSEDEKAAEANDAETPPVEQ
jgi:hypothetical protein